MKKRNGLKSAVLAMMAAGMLCACENNAEPEAVRPAGGEAAPEVTEAPGSAEESESSEEPAAAEQEEEPAAVKIVTEPVESVTIRFYIGYNIATGDAISDTIPCHTVEVTGEDLAKISEILPELSVIREDPESEAYGHIRYDYINDIYELIINDDLVLDIGEKYGYIVSGGGMFAVPEKLFDIVDRIAEEYSENSVYAALDAEEITVTDMDGRELEITDPDELELLRSVEYYTINATDEMFENERVAYVMDLHNGDQLDIFFASVLGVLRHADGSYEYVNIGQMEEYLNRIFAE